MYLTGWRVQSVLYVVKRAKHVDFGPISKFVEFLLMTYTTGRSTQDGRSYYPQITLLLDGFPRGRVYRT